MHLQDYGLFVGITALRFYNKGVICYNSAIILFGEGLCFLLCWVL